MSVLVIAGEKLSNTLGKKPGTRLHATTVYLLFETVLFCLFYVCMCPFPFYLNLFPSFSSTIPVRLNYFISSKMTYTNAINNSL